MMILAYLNQGRIDFALEKERKKNKVLGINPHHKDVSFSEDKILFSFPSQKNEIHDVIQEMESLRTQINEIQSSIQLQEIYELVSSENQGFSLEDLCALLYNTPSPLQKLAFSELLSEDRFFFRQKNHLFFPKTQDEVELSIKKAEMEKEKEAQKNQEQENALAWFEKKLVQKSEEREVPDFIHTYLKSVKEFAIQGDETPKKSQALEILQNLNQKFGFNMEGNPVYAAFRLLRDVGIFSEDENLLLKRYSLSLYSQEEESQECLEILKNFNINYENRKDLTQLESYSIDDEQTRDIDDALSWEKTESGYRFWVHIADVAEVIPKDSALEKKAQKKTSSIYLPDIQFPMFPKEISENLCSLLQGEARYALSFCIKTSENFEVQETQIFPSVIQVTRNETYENIDKILENKEHPQYHFFNTFYQFALKFQNQRLYEWNGVDFLFPSIYPRIKDGKIHLKMFDPFSKSSFLVKEMMVLANLEAAGFCDKNHLPALYLVQDAPDSELELRKRALTSKTELFPVLRFMKKSYFSSQPQPHFALGLRHYTQATSPIRRYLDLMIQRQIKSALNQLALAYSKEEIQEIKINLETQKPVIGHLEGETNKYWLLKHLLIHERNKPLNAVIMKELPDGYVAEIEQTLTPAKIISKQKLTPGEKITVKLHTIIPRLGIALGNL